MIKLSKKRPNQYAGDMVVYFVRQSEKKAPNCNNGKVQAMINEAYESGDFKGKEGQTFLYYRPVTAGRKKIVQRVLVVGLGKDDPAGEVFRRAGGTASASALKSKARKILVVIPEFIDFSVAEMSQALCEGVILGSYQFLKYKAVDDPDDEPGKLDEISFYAADDKAAQEGLRHGEIIAMAGCLARDVGNEPGNRWTPTHFAEYGKKLAKKQGLSYKVLSKNDMKRLGMGGILGVNQGSAEPPKMTILEYRAGRKKVPTLLLVGKGLTFDSGGISLKPSAGMEEMKFDKCGGAAVLAVMQAMGELKPKTINVVGIIPATENLPGPAALKPGDVISIYGGKTVEVINTDAEGRLILADALAYGVKKYKPDFVIDIATLTGAVIIGLGHHRTGLLSNNDELCKKVIDAGEKSGEPVWQLPLGAEYTKQLKSKVADLKNVDKRDAGTITAACFLQEFVGETAWAHLDIAGTAWNFTEKSYIPKGPSGIGVRLLLELIGKWQ